MRFINSYTADERGSDEVRHCACAQSVSVSVYLHRDLSNTSTLASAFGPKTGTKSSQCIVCH